MSRFQTVVEALQHWAQEKPDSTAIIFRDKNQRRSVMTWDSIYTLSGRFAADLRSKGIARGGLVINTLPNSPERVVCEAGIWMSGAASVNGQCLLADGSDLLNTISVSRASAILVDPDVKDSPWNVLKNHVTLGQDNTCTSSSLPNIKNVFFVRRVENASEGDFIGHLKSSDDWFQAEDITPDDIFTIFTTSGTTGFSKLVIHTHGTLTGHLQNDTTVVDIVTKKPSQLCLAPQGWVGGCLALFFVPGVTYITCDCRPGNPDDLAMFIWSTLQEEKCSSVYLSASYLPRLIELAKHQQQIYDSDHVSPLWKPHVALLVGFPVTQSIVKASLTLAEAAYVGYGSTDTHLISGHLVTDSQSYIDHDAGNPFSHYTVKIVNPDNEDVKLPTDQLGHIFVKGPLLFKGYLNDPKKTAEAFTKDGFFRTGDIGRLDERGHLIVEGRGSDAIMRGAYIFYPTWIEKRLRACPGVQDVVVVGVPDPFLHEDLCACLVLESSDVSLDQVRQHMEEDVVVSDNNPLSPRPRYYLNFDSFPQTNTLKPKRKDIKLIAVQRLGLSQEN